MTAFNLTPLAQTIFFGSSNGPLLIIKPDGTVEGKLENMSEAARAFVRFVRFLRLHLSIPMGMKPWNGGDGPPKDWDGGSVICDDGAYYDGPFEWQRPSGGPDIIAYTPKPAPQPVEDVERLREVIDRLDAAKAEGHVIALHKTDAEILIAAARLTLARHRQKGGEANG